MRVIKYVTHLDKDRKNILVKESSSNYPNIQNQLNNPQRIADLINIIYNATVLTEEYVWLLALDTKCKLIGLFDISHGTVNASLVTPREIFVKLCLCGATNFVIVHNHPTGDSTPSEQDIKITQQLKEVGEIMNIELLDHIIIGYDYYSFQEKGHLK